MTRFTFIALTLLLSGCAIKSVTYQPYNTSPMTAICAYHALVSMGDYGVVEKKKRAILFYGESVRGALHHGGEVSFTRFALEINTSTLSGPDHEEVSARIIEELKTKCAFQSV